MKIWVNFYTWLIFLVLTTSTLQAESFILKLKSGQKIQVTSKELIKEYRESDIEYLEKNFQIQAHATPADPQYQRQSIYMDLVNAPDAWNHIANTPSITIAVIDSGIDLDHPDLRENLWVNHKEIPGNNIDDDKNGLVDDVHGYNFLDDSSDLQDINGHGTKISGIIGAVGQNDTGIAGISWRCKLMVLKILDEDGNSSVSNAIEAIDYAIENGAQIINASWGFHASSTPAKYSKALYESINRAKEKGILFVSSVGNGGENYEGKNNDAAKQTNFPSSYDLSNIISVASTNLKDELAFFSNYGLHTVDIAAPGIDIFSTDLAGDYDSMTGTSISAGFVSGTAALLWQLNPELGYSEIKELIIDSSDAILGVTGKSLLGGRLNIGNAIENSPALIGLPLVDNSDDVDSGAGFDLDNLPSSQSSGGCQMMAKENKASALWLSFFLLGLFLFLKKKTQLELS